MNATMSKIDGIIDILKEDDGAMIPRPANHDDINKCQEYLTELGLEPLPEGFIDFLMEYNGLAWNGIEFYSTDQVVNADDPDGYKLMDIPTMNDEFNVRYEMHKKVLLGRTNKDYFTFNIETFKYEILQTNNCEITQEFENFEDLFQHTVGSRLESS